MSLVNPQSPELTSPNLGTHPAPSAKKKNNKKKKNANKPKPVDTDGANNGGDGIENGDLTDEPVTPVVVCAVPFPPRSTRAGPYSSKCVLFCPPCASPSSTMAPARSHTVQNESTGGDATASPTKPESQANGHAATAAKPTNGHAVESAPAESVGADADSDTSAKLEAMSQEREALRAEVEQLRKQLESIQETHTSEVGQLKTDLEESEAAKEQAESQYQTLLGRVAHIRETLGDRLKRDKADLDAARDRIEELEKDNEELRSGAQSTDGQVGRLQEELQEQSRELSNLRSRSNLSQQNWVKEKDDMTRQLQHLRSELESTSAAMGEWEVIAMEERSMRESLADKSADLEEQLGSLRDAYQRAAEERDTQSQAIDGLQRALQEIQDARRKELREMVETSEEQLQSMKKVVQEANTRAAAAEASKETLTKELERMAPFEKEVKEKSLLIGKLRHEAIGLNEHLTRALKYIKKNKPDEMIDR